MGSAATVGCWLGGSVGGLLKRQFVASPQCAGLERLLRDDLGVDVTLADCLIRPGPGASLLRAPA